MKTLYRFLLFLAVPLILMFLGFTGGSPGAKSGSPGDSFSNCTDCHSGTAQNATDWIISDIPDLGYSAGETYTITAMVEHTGSSKFGFEVTAEDSDGLKVGEIVITDAARTSLINDSKGITHTASGTEGSANINEWSFDWIAPEGTTGDVTFYGAFNATNSDFLNTGDVIYLSTYTVSPDVTAIDELSSNFRFYPNPSNGLLNIENPDFKNASSVMVFSTTGQLVEEFKLNSEYTSLNLTHLSKGIYFVRLNNQTSRMQKLVIN